MKNDRSRYYGHRFPPSPERRRIAIKGIAVSDPQEITDSDAKVRVEYVV